MRLNLFIHRACEPPMPGLVNTGCLLLLLGLIAWTKIIVALNKVADAEAQQHIIKLIENGFEHLDLEQLK